MAEDGQDDDAPSSQELQADDDDDCRRQQLEAANSDLRETQEELEMYKQMQGEKVDQSKQFQQLKKVGTLRSIARP